MPEFAASTQPRPYGVSCRLAVLLAFALCAAATAVVLSQPASARAATVSPTLAPALGRHVHGRRVGGPVHSAWPAKGRAPRTSQARWLARQVGQIKPRLCATQRRQAPPLPGWARRHQRLEHDRTPAEARALLRHPCGRPLVQAPAQLVLDL
jgi:hypothetical protein